MLKYTIYTILSILLVSLSSANAQFYYSDNRQIPINVDSSRVLVLIENELHFDFNDFQLAYPRIDSISSNATIDNFQIVSLNNMTNYCEFIDSLRIDNRISIANPYFRNSVDSSIMMGKTICCKFADHVPYAFIDSLNNEYSVEIINENYITPKLFLLGVQNDIEHSVLEIANIYYELNETEFCHPNFKGGFEWNDYYIYDNYWVEQWAMHRIFNTSPLSVDSLNHRAFQLTTGDSNIVVAVVDMGIMPHEDLPANRIVAGYDFANMDIDPSPCTWPLYGGHGECVAGIIAASHNRYPEFAEDPNTGVYGIAPKTKVMPIRIGTGFPVDVYDTGSTSNIAQLHPSCVGLKWASDYHIAGAIEWAWTHGADIISCSWGNPDPYDNLHFALQQASILGRDGKGCAIFVSSGNRATDTTYYPAVYPEVISVSSLLADDSLWGYSCRAKVDLVAPSGPLYHNHDLYGHGIWTTDLMGSSGYNTNLNSFNCIDPDDDDYLCVFGGTSAAQPVAAGVAALVLSVRPELTRTELYDILENSADRELYETITNPPHQEYGYGMVHPYRALLAISRGDVNIDGDINILDILYLIDYKFQYGPEPEPEVSMGDVTCDGMVNVMDIIFLIDYKEGTGPAPDFCFNYDLLE